MPPAHPFVELHRDGIHVIDTGFHRPRFDASFLVVHAGRAAFVDTGTNHGVPRLLAGLQALGLRPADVDWVIATHAHLDHAGGAGLLMQHLPEARLVAHPRAAPHLVEPSRLMAGARAVYGEAEVQRAYGEAVPVPESRVLQTHDGMTLDWHGRALTFIDTPGHARHHHCVWDAQSRGWFTGDTFGISYREFDTAHGPWITPTTTPVQFEPDALLQSVRRLLDADPQWMYLTHFGPVDRPRALGVQLTDQIDEMVALGLSLADAPERHPALRRGLEAMYLRRLRAHGCTMDDADIVALLAMDIELNAQGLGIWLDKRAAAR